MANKKKAVGWSKQPARNSEPGSFLEGSPSGCSSVSVATSHRVTTSPSPNMTLAFYVDLSYVGTALVVAILCLAAEQHLHYV